MRCTAHLCIEKRKLKLAREGSPVAGEPLITSDIGTLSVFVIMMMAAVFP
jgi:hypothetical protein